MQLVPLTARGRCEAGGICVTGGGRGGGKFFCGGIRNPTPGGVLYPRLRTESDPGVDLGGAMLRVALTGSGLKAAALGVYILSR